MSKEWRVIPGYPDYKVSSEGEIISMKFGKERLLNYGKDTAGYYQANLYRNGIQKTMNAHKVVASAFLGECPEGLIVRHLDDDKSNNHVSNLAYGTHKQNGEDAVRNGKYPKGEAHYFSKLTETDVKLIKALRTFGWTHKFIGEIMSVSRRNVCFILQGKSWSHI